MQTQVVGAKTLKERHRLVRDAQREDLRVRIHRAISWLARAEQEADDHDARFVFLWIALNAAYAKEFGFETSEREQVRAFIDKVVSYDQAGRLQDAVFRQFTGPIRALVENKLFSNLSGERCESTTAVAAGSSSLRWGSAWP